MKTRRIKCWPFPVSVLRNGTTVLNVPPPKPKVRPKKLKRIPSPDKWTQDALL